MTSIHFVGGEKGGEGRSFVCRALIDYHRVQQIPFSAFDTCRSYSDVSRFYNSAEGCEVKGFSHEDSLPEIASDVFRKNLEGNVIVNLHTHGMKQLVWPWIEEDRYDRMSELQRKNAIIWFVSIGSCDSYRLLEESLHYFSQSGVRHILVKNLGSRSFWGIDDVDDKFERISAEHDIPMITFPRFPDGKALRAILEEDIPYLEAQQHPAFSRLQRNQSSIFLEGAFAALGSLNIV